MKVCAVIVAYNGEQWIEKCLSSLQQSVIPVSIIVIDNASADNTINIVNQKFPQVDLVEAGSNLGFGQANNVGFRMALKQSADYIFLLNQDAWVNENAIAELMSVAHKYPEYGILSPFHLSVDESNFERQFVDFLAPNYNSKIVPDFFFQRLQDVYETHYIHAAAWFMTRQCVETVGGFDPIYFHYGEDDDYMQRARHFSFKIGLVPSATIVHDGAYKSWEQLEWNENRNTVMELQYLKRMFPHFRTNVLSYLKKSFDELTSLLLFRKFKKFRFRFKIIWKTMKRIGAIRSSYKASFKKGAFLS